MEERLQPLVLVVDDDERSRRLTEIVLSIEGYRVIAADGGEQALDLLGREAPAIAVVDLLMPGMDGLELCRRIRASGMPRHLPVVVLSGMDDLASREAARLAGADDFIVKPFDRAVLRERLAMLLGR